jgi:hypothetical protein
MSLIFSLASKDPKWDAALAKIGLFPDREPQKTLTLCILTGIKVPHKAISY